MPRNYRLPLGPWRGSLLLALSGGSLLGLACLQGPAARSDNLFAAQPVQEHRFAVLARPVGQDDWNLLVLEQIRTSPLCWTSRPDGLIDPSLNRFDFTGICSRYLDSNGYSLRIGEQDLASSYRLRLVQVRDELRLLASTVSQPNDLLVGRGRVPLRDRDGFVQINLESGWNLQRRTYQGRTLSHIYFSNSESLPVLLARLQPPAAAVASADSQGSRLLSRLGPVSPTPVPGAPALTALGDPAVVAIPGRPVPLQVIPFRE